MTDDLLAIPPMFAGRPEYLAKHWPVRSTKSVVQPLVTARITATKPLSSALGRKAQTIALLVGRHPCHKSNLVDMFDWHIAEIARAVNLAKGHGLIREKNGILTATGER